ncbi:MAG: hypothetical protein ACJAVI_004693 [Candidatus Azotimanducaceae bacterium]|jgi:hypothetical protein
MKNRPRRMIIMLAGCVSLLSSCASIEPWVSPYERSALADPIMTFARGPADASYMHHVHQAREGARGAEGGAGGGCGCN